MRYSSPTRRSALTAVLLAVALLVPGAARAATRAKNPHEFSSIGCTHCHLVVPGQSQVVRKKIFRKDISELCLECHEDSRENQINHRTGIRPSMRVPDDLHLGTDGTLTCITCHQPHLAYEDRRSGGKTFFLRRSLLKRELCLACHYEEKFAEPTTTFSIIAPVDNAIVKTLPVPFIAVASDDLVTEASLFINGSPVRLPVEYRTVSTLLTLQEGVNNLKLEAKRAKTISMTLLYSPGLPEDLTYKLYYSHGILKKSDCRLCHPEGKPGAIATADQELCGKCHEGKNRLRHLHGPVAAGSCTVCHDPHGQTNRYFLLARGEKLCLTCHTEKEVLLHFIDKSATNAELLRTKGCEYCHDPHQSDKKYLLRRNNQ